MKKIIVSFILCLFSIIGHTQSMNAFYYMYFVPQANNMNPAIQPKSNVYINLFESSVSLESPVAIEDVMWYDEEMKMSVLFADSLGDVSRFENALGKYNFLGGDAQIQTFPSFGFRVGENYFNFGIFVKNFSRASVPGDFIKYGLHGNESGDLFDFSSLTLDQTTYTEIALGYSRNLDDRMTVGGKIKGLFGLANFSTKINSFYLDTDRREWEVDMDAEANMNVPALEFELNEEGEYDYSEPKEMDDDQLIDDLISSTSNFGLGLDLGLVYKPIDRVSVSASLIDLGFINWKTNPYNITIDGKFSFDGIDADTLIDGSDYVYLMDSILDVGNPSHTNAAYTTYTPAKLFIGGQYFLTPKINVGLLSRSEFYKGSLREEATLSLNWLLWRWMSGTFTYSLANYTSSHWGFGWSFRLPPLQMYILLDNLGFRYAQEVNDKYPVPISMDAFSLRFGMNIAVGFKGDKKKLKDQPLIY